MSIRDLKPPRRIEVEPALTPTGFCYGDKISRKVASDFGGVEHVGFTISLVAEVGARVGEYAFEILLETGRMRQLFEAHGNSSSHDIVVDVTQHVTLSEADLRIVRERIEKNLDDLRRTGVIKEFRFNASHYQTDKLFPLTSMMYRTPAQEAELKVLIEEFEISISR